MNVPVCKHCLLPVTSISDQSGRFAYVPFIGCQCFGDFYPFLSVPDCKEMTIGELPMRALTTLRYGAMAG